MLTICTINKICAGCKQEFPATIEYFGKESATKDGLRRWCKACIVIRNKKYRQSEQGIRYYKDYHKNYRATINGLLRQTFHNMVARCTDPNQQGYKWYGGAGIKCLFTSSQEFVDYVVNVLRIDPRGFEIDRIDSKGHYEKGNIRFVTHIENLQNRRKYGS